MIDTAVVQPLNWDSEFMGYKVGRLHASQLDAAALQALLATARAQSYRLLYWFVAPNDMVSQAGAQAVGAFLADHKIRIVQPVAAGGPTELPTGIAPATVTTPELEALAVQASEHSRFRVDPEFAPVVAVELYRRWLQRSFAGEQAREVLGYQAEPGQPATGLLILGATTTRAEMILMAVDAARRGQGVGGAFIEAARRRARAWGLPELQLVTQANNPACRLYEREGFRLEHTELVYHLWL